ncbi:hypothetical protein PoB_001096200 [Plakobranchus ocellatus]|uniref:Uncharacterized protein n=1 Tax=Plakobranchus ocellatus TaxID=259542 RepID=A0AAV3YQN7_9GAST|nr:hypothetical protein PoB_001096200 [Plakobranchus ocellatus]
MLGLKEHAFFRLFLTYGTSEPWVIVAWRGVERRGGAAQQGVEWNAPDGHRAGVVWTTRCRPGPQQGRRWQGSNPRRMGPCRSQGGLTSHCATDASKFAGTILSRVRAPPQILWPKKKGLRASDLLDVDWLITKSKANPPISKEQFTKLQRISN